jgi:NlpC/P60 family protein
MRLLGKLAIATIICAFTLAGAFPQQRLQDTAGLQAPHGVSKQKKKPNQRERRLSRDERRSLLAVAMDSRVWQNSEPDCSHLVHAIYKEAGFSYAYAPSSDIYAGIEGFQRAKSPQSGDLVVWRGHVGIVTQPSHHIFFSFLSSGPGTDDYESAYWRHRGQPRFYRYLKNSCCSN